MTNTITPVSLPELGSGAAPASAPNAPAPPAGSQAPDAGVATSEAVTLSAAAQTSTQLLSAARAASGIDQAQVAQIRSALQAGTYNVAPEDLAQAIATVLKETS